MTSSSIRCLGSFGLVLSLVLHVLDQATDVFASFLFFAEGRVLPAVLTLAFVFLPGVFIGLCEVKRMCSGKSNLAKAVGYILFAPLWSIVIHLYSLCDIRYIRSALYFKTIEAFLEAGPQLLLQLSLLFRGSFSHSSGLVLDPILDANEQVEESFLVHDAENETIDGTMEVFGRYYGKDEQYFFGSIHILSVICSFVSIFVTTVVFNDVEDVPLAAGSAAGFLAKLSVAVPFFFCTLVFRAGALAIIICFMEWWGGVLIFFLFFANVLSALSIGDSYGRACSYGVWSVLVPVGYNRDPGTHLGYTKVPLKDAIMDQEEGSSLSVAQQQNEEMTDKDIQRSASRARYFLTLHVLSSMFLIGTSLILCIILVQTYPEKYELNSTAAFDLSLLNTVFLPFLGITLGFSVLLVRPYHRCECSGGETKAGNAIV